MATSNTGVSDDQLFISLTADLITQAWVALGKIKNPITDKLEPNLQASALLIDMLDMLIRKTEGHRSDEETKVLEENIKQLKLNYIAEQQAAAERPAEESPAEKPSEDTETANGDDAEEAHAENEADSASNG